MLGDRIRELRTKRGMTQKELADILGVTDAAIGMWENARREPDVEHIKKMAAIFGVTLDNVDGWLGFQAVLRNRTPGIPNEAREWLQPCLSGLPFNLGNQGYAIPPVVRKVIVIWE